MPRECIGPSTPICWWHAWKMEKHSLSWLLPWMLTCACLISGLGPEPHNFSGFSQFYESFGPSFWTVNRTFEGLPELETTGFRAKFKTCSSTQREGSNESAPLIPASDLQFSSINDSEFQDLFPVQEGTNLQGPSLDSEGATRGWFDVKSLPPINSTADHSASTEQSDVKSSSTANGFEHSSTTLRQSKWIRCPVERLAFAATLLCTSKQPSLTCWKTSNEIFSMASLCPDNMIPVMSPKEFMAFAVSNDPDTLTCAEATWLLQTKTIC